MPEHKKTENFGHLPAGGKLVAEAAIRKSLKAELISGSLFLVEGNGTRQFFDSSMANSIGHIAGTITWNKELTKLFLDRSRIPTPRGVAFRQGRLGKALAFMKSSKATRFVLKPPNGVLGANVFMGIYSENKLREKVTVTPRKFKTLLLEEQVAGTECRYFPVGDRVIAVAERRPANVISDGRLTVRELIDLKNASRDGHLALVPIVLDGETMNLLAEQGLGPDGVPPSGQLFRLKRVSNISQGGDSIDITDEVHDDLKDLAVAALRSIPTLSYAGIDIIAENHRAPLAGQQAVVLELNWFPMMIMHHAPAVGRPRDVAGAIIDHLFFRIRQRTIEFRMARPAPRSSTRVEQFGGHELGLERFHGWSPYRIRCCIFCIMRTLDLKLDSTGMIARKSAVQKWAGAAMIRHLRELTDILPLVRSMDKRIILSALGRNMIHWISPV